MKITLQLKHLLRFELLFFFKRIMIYLVLATFLCMAFFGGSSLFAFSSGNLYRNSPFAITYIFWVSLVILYFNDYFTGATDAYQPIFCYCNENNKSCRLTNLTHAVSAGYCVSRVCYFRCHSLRCSMGR